VSVCFNFTLQLALLQITRLILISFYTPQLVPAGTAEARIRYGNSVCLSVCLSQPGGIPSSGEIETPGLHHMAAWSI